MEASKIEIWNYLFVERAQVGDIILDQPYQREYWKKEFARLIAAAIRAIEEGTRRDLDECKAWLALLKTECWTPTRDVLVKRPVQ